MRAARVSVLAAAAVGLLATAMLTAPSAGATAAPASPVGVTSDAQNVQVGGGDVIYSDTWAVCKVAFNVQDGSGSKFALMPGHCTDGTTTWYADAARTIPVGPTVGSSFPGNDYGLVRYDNPDVLPAGTANGVDITSAANAYVGQTVMTKGSTTGTHSGTVTALNATVNYGGGDVVYGLIQTNVCSEPEPGGMGPLTSGSLAIGIPSGGSGNCSTGGTTFYQPVVDALNAYGVSIY